MMWWTGLVILWFGCNGLTSGQGNLQCPIISNRQCVTILNQCQTTADCTEAGIGCCYVPGCGRECIKLVPRPTPGVCPNPPPFDTDFCSRALVIKGCDDDRNCSSEGKKCCPAGRCNVLDCVTPITGPRPGCPRTDNVVCVRYQQLCNKDTDCKKGEQCCYNPSCGTSCSGPVTNPINRPECPSVSILCKRYQDLCKSDADCGKDKVCCYSSSCGRFCSNRPRKPTSKCRRICQLPKKPGPCEAYIPSYYYDVNTKSCQKFIYGGCQGNDNRFKTLVECQNKCGSGPKCGPVCLISCPFGNVLDKDGCPICECKTGQTNKPGVCPKNTNPGVICPAVVRPGDCITDASCRGNEKCCSQGCSRVCLDPVPPCPSIQCNINCPNGYQVDQDGCQTCKCKEPTLCLTCCGPPNCCGPCIQCDAGHTFTGKFCNVNGSTCSSWETCKTDPSVGSHGICCA